MEQILCLVITIFSVSFSLNNTYIVFTTTQSIAQSKQTPEPPKDKKRNGKPATINLRQRGMEIIRSEIENLSSSNDLRNASYLKAVMSDLLWPYDSDSARLYLKDSFDQAVKFYLESGGYSRVKITKTGSIDIPDVRLEIVNIALRRDASLGKGLQSRYLEEKKKELEAKTISEYGDKNIYEQTFGTSEIWSNELLRLAEKFLDSDVDKSAELARQSLASGIPRDFANFLSQMSAYNRAKADQLYLEGLIRLVNNQTTSPGQLLLLSAYPFNDERIVLADGKSIYFVQIEKQSNYVFNEQLVQKFISTAFDVIGRIVHAEGYQPKYRENQLSLAFFAVKVLEMKIAKYRPALSAQWGELTDALLSLQTEVVTKRIENNLERHVKSSEPPSTADTQSKIKQLLADAPNAKTQEKQDDLYVSAAQEALIAGDAEYAVEIASKVRNLTYREKALSWFSYEAAIKALGKGDIFIAEKFAADVKPIDQRVYLLLRMAKDLKGNDVKDRKRILLENALYQSRNADSGAEKLNAFVAISNFYLDFDKERAVEIVPELIGIASNVQNYNLQPSRLIRALVKSGGGGYTSVVNYEGFDISNLFIKLARNNKLDENKFDETLLLARSIENSTIRSLAVTAIGTVMLGSEPTNVRLSR